MNFLQEFRGEIKVLLIVAIVVIVLAVGGILLLKAVQPTPSPQPQAIDTSNWQTYRSDEFGFEVKYPEGWQVSVDSTFIQFRDPESDRGERKQINLHISNYPASTLEEYIETYMVGRDYTLSSIEDSTIGDILAKKAVITGGDVANEEPYISFLMLHREKVYRWNGTDQDILAKILSTFRFVE